MIFRRTFSPIIPTYVYRRKAIRTLRRSLPIDAGDGTTPRPVRALASGLSAAPDLTVTARVSGGAGRRSGSVAENCPIMGLGSFGKRVFWGPKRILRCMGTYVQAHFT